MNANSVRIIGVFITTVILWGGCEKSPGNRTGEPQYGNTSALHRSIPEYVFAVHPLHNSRRYFEIYQPLVEYINRRTSEFSLRLEASKDYAHFEEKLVRQQLHFAVPNPYQTVRVLDHGYTVFGKMGDDERFYGIILTRKSNHITSVQQLRNAAISFPSPTALAAAMMPKYFLQSQGLDVQKEVTCLYVGSQESSIMNVYLGRTTAGCTWPPPWESYVKEHPEVGNALTVQWKTPPLINNGLVARNDVPARHIALLSSLLFTLQENDDGRAILRRINVSRYEPVGQGVYAAAVNQFLDRYRKMFGALPEIGRNP